MNIKFVTIITPMYNSSKYISETIKSVQNQTYYDWEMIIVDDCSTDNSTSIVANIASIDDRIILIYQSDNLGAAQARNSALELAKGRFIAFLDSDDLWRPDKLKKQVSFMIRNQVAVSFTSYNLIDEMGNSKGHTYHSVEKINQQEYLKNTIIGLSTSMIDTKFVGNDFRFIDIRTRQDTSLWISILGRGFVAYGMSEVLASYRVHSNSISSNKYRAAKQVWNLYFNIHRLGFFKSVYCFLFYLYNAIKKRI
jgi:teichuronic acid biosynthesis glycosyltransferase TuaG